MEDIPVMFYMCPELITALMEIFAPKPPKDNRPSEKEKIEMAKHAEDHNSVL
jgi:hypothetical protein